MTDTLFLTVLHGGLIPEQTAQDNISDILVKKKKKNEIKCLPHLCRKMPSFIISNVLFFFKSRISYALCTENIQRMPAVQCLAFPMFGHKQD
jgi:hypothetical protein